jgi:hypothetical protein
MRKTALVSGGNKIRLTRIKKMNKTVKAKILDKYALSEKIKKGELLRLMKVLDVRSGSRPVIRGFKKLPSSALERKTSGLRYSQATLGLLRRYFAQRMRQSLEFDGAEGF